MVAVWVGVALSKKLFDKAVNSALGKVNTGIVRITERQLKALNNFLRGKDLFVCFPYRPWQITRSDQRQRVTQAKTFQCTQS